MLEEIRQKLCKHKHYKVVSCEKDDTFYFCQCSSCGLVIKKLKAAGEIYSNDI